MNPALELAIALSFIFFLGAVICSGINEIVASAANLRATYLKKGIPHLLAGDDSATAFYDNPLVKSLYKTRKPSYIPSGTFALAVFDALVPPTATGVTPTKAAVRDAIASLPNGNYKASLESLWRSVNADVGQFRTAVASWFDAPMERVTGWYRLVPAGDPVDPSRHRDGARGRAQRQRRQYRADPVARRRSAGRGGQAS